MPPSEYQTERYNVNTLYLGEVSGEPWELAYMYQW